MSFLNDRVAVITGGTYGVGRGIARALAHEGARVFVTGRSAPEGAAEGGIMSIRCDHREDADVLTAFAIEYGFKDIDGKAPRLLTLAEV